MTASNYQYDSDNGTTYQVTLPDDFASVLGFSPAAGGEPYLDQIIHPRVVNYVTDTGIFRQVVITTRAIFTNLPSPLSVAGNVYTARGSVSETVLPYASPALVLASGAPGAPGPAGSSGIIARGSLDLAADVNVTASGAYTTLFDSTPGPGDYFFCASLELSFGAVLSTQVEFIVQDVASGTNYEIGTVSLGTTAGREHFSAQQLITLTGSGRFLVVAHDDASGAAYVIRTQSPLIGLNGCTRVAWLHLA